MLLQVSVDDLHLTLKLKHHLFYGSSFKQPLKICPQTDPEDCMINILHTKQKLVPHADGMQNLSPLLGSSL